MARRGSVPGTNPTSQADYRFGNHSTTGGNPGTPTGATRHTGRAGDGRSNMAGQVAQSNQLQREAEAQCEKQYRRKIPMDGRGR